MQNTDVLSHASSAVLAQKIAVYHFGPNSNSTTLGTIMKLGYAQALTLAPL